MPRAGLSPEAVVDAAVAVADERGVEATTLAAVAQRLGVRSPSLYAHVAGLADLRRRLGERGARELAAALQRSSAGRAGSDALHAVALAYRDFAHRHPGIYAAMQRAPAANDPGAAQAADELYGVILAALAGYELPESAVVHAVRAIRAALHGFVSLEREGGFAMPVAVSDSYERLVEMLDGGLRVLAREAGSPR